MNHAFPRKKNIPQTIVSRPCLCSLLMHCSKCASLCNAAVKWSECSKDITGLYSKYTNIKYCNTAFLSRTRTLVSVFRCSLSRLHLKNQQSCSRSQTNNPSIHRLLSPLSSSVLGFLPIRM